MQEPVCYVDLAEGERNPAWAGSRRETMPSLDGTQALVVETARLLNGRQAATLPCISARTLWSLTASHEIVCVRIRRKVLYRREDLRAFVEERLDRRKPWSRPQSPSVVGGAGAHPEEQARNARRAREITAKADPDDGSRIYRRRRMAALPICHVRLVGTLPWPKGRGYPEKLRTKGDVIRQRRLDRGLTQTALRRLLGVGTASVSAWERGGCAALGAMLGALGRALGEDVLPFETDFPGRLRNARRRLGLTQEELARRAGVDPRSVRSWETGKYLPLERTLAKVGRVVGPIKPRGRTEAPRPAHAAGDQGRS